jgi:hypothetical protein
MKQLPLAWAVMAALSLGLANLAHAQSANANLRPDSDTPPAKISSHYSDLANLPTQGGHLSPRVSASCWMSCSFSGPCRLIFGRCRHSTWLR